MQSKGQRVLAAVAVAVAVAAAAFPGPRPRPRVELRPVHVQVRTQGDIKKQLSNIKRLQLQQLRTHVCFLRKNIGRAGEGRGLGSHTHTHTAGVHIISAQKTGTHFPSDTLSIWPACLPVCMFACRTSKANQLFGISVLSEAEAHP